MVDKKTNFASFVKKIYDSEFQWSLIKSLGIFFLGVRLAKELVGVEIMPALAART